MFAYFVGRQIANESVAGLDQLNSPFVKLVEIVGRVEKTVAPVAAEPAGVFDDGVDIFGFFFGRIGVVEAQIALAAELLGQPEIQVDGFCVADVQIAVRLRWKTRVDAPAVLVGLQIIQDDFADEVGNRRIGAGGFGLGLGNVHISFSIVQRSWRSHECERGTQECVRYVETFEAGLAAQDF